MLPETAGAGEERHWLLWREILRKTEMPFQEVGGQKSEVGCIRCFLTSDVRPLTSHILLVPALPAYFTGE